MTPHLSPRRLLVIALLALLASACSTPDNSEPPAPLTEIDGAMAVDRLWSLDSGEGAAHGFVNLRPLLLADNSLSCLCRARRPAGLDRSRSARIGFGIQWIGRGVPGDDTTGAGAVIAGGATLQPALLTS